VAIGGTAAALRALFSGNHVVAVLPARWIWMSEDFAEPRLDEDLAERVSGQILKGGGPVIAWPLVEQHRGEKLLIRRTTGDLNARFGLVVSVRNASGGMRVTAFMVDGATGRKMQVVDLQQQELKTPADRERVASTVAHQTLASTR